jgi:predicted metal-binding membrane protein
MTALRTSLRGLSWLAFFGVILLAWWVMFDMARMSGVDIWGRPVGMNMMPMESFGTLFAMWAIMMAAMMLPTLVPTLGTYDALIRSADGTRAGWAGVLLGYFAVWIGVAALLAAVQVGALRTGVVDGLGAFTSVWLSGLLLLGVGLFQFSRLKAVCHGVCHSPMTYFLGHWRTGFVGGARMGAGLGAFCAGCCWGLMALGFVGGTMSLVWMGLATLFMVVEKLPQIGAHVTKPMGLLLMTAGLGVIAFAATGL